MNNNAASLFNQSLSNEPKVIEKGLRLSTADYSAHERHDWLQEMICQEFARVKITPPSQQNLFNETILYEWEKLRLSVIKSNGLTLERLSREPCRDSQDNYLAVVLLSGQYLMEQAGREVFLQPGDMTIYDATRPHRIYSSSGFSKLIVTIPRKVMQDRILGVEHCTALQVSGKNGMGAVAAHFIQSVANQAENMRGDEFFALSEQSLDLITLALTSVRPHNFILSRSRSISLMIVKDFIAQYLADTQLDTAMIVAGTRFSERYINDLFKDENTSLIRYVWACRLEKCHKDIQQLSFHPVSTVAFKWGFNNTSHFSRAFKKRFGISPTELKALSIKDIENGRKIYAN